MENQEINSCKIFYRPENMWIEVTAEEKQAWERVTCAFRKKMQRKGECVIHFTQSYLCDGNCDECEYYRKDDSMISIDQECLFKGESWYEKVLSDPALTTEMNTDVIFIRNELRALESCDPEGYSILMYFAMGLSERESAERMGMKKSTYVYKRDKLIAALREKFLV